MTFDLNFSMVCSPILATTPEPVVHLKLSPNPASKEFAIETSTSDLDEINLVSLDGRTVKTLSAARNSSVKIPVGDLAAGVYLAQIIAGKRVLVEKLVVSH